MPQYTLGISAFYHDSAACLLVDGVVLAAAQEERFTRIKQDASFPKKAIEYCLSQAGITIDNIDAVAYYEKPILKFDRLLSTYVNHAPKGFLSFKMAMKSWLKEKLWIPNIIKKELKYKGEVFFTHHHESHAASAYYTSEYQSTAFLTVDGVGEYATTTYGVAKGNELTTLGEIHFPHSLGLLYSAFTYYCGFKVNSGEYKLMGLAPYGKPKYTDLIKEKLVKIREDGSIQMNMDYFSYEYALKMITPKFEEVFGSPTRKPESEMTQFYKDVAASIQVVTEEIVLKLAAFVKKKTGESNLCMAGGVALNCVANGKLQEEGVFDNVWVPSAAGDAGGALGAALLVWHEHLKQPKKTINNDLLTNSYLGVSFENKSIQKVLDEYSLNYEQPHNNELVNHVAEQLANKKIIGWFQGRMEFGPRALGARSILASPVFEDMQQHVNLKIKKREGFRPFAPLVIEEKAEDWFDMPPSSKSMLYTYQCKQPKKIPACVHVDQSSRVQTLAKNDQPKLYALLEAFEKITACPVLINTSFNVRGEPIVCTPLDAIQCFFSTDMDVLVLGDFVLLKEIQKNQPQLIKDYALD